MSTCWKVSADFSWWVWSELELELSKYYSGFKMFADSWTMLLGNLFGLLHHGKYLCVNPNCYVNTNFYINKVCLWWKAKRSGQIIPPYTSQQGAQAWEPCWWYPARSKLRYWECKCPSLFIPKLKFTIKEKQNSYTESSYIKLESTTAEHSTEISVVLALWKYFGEKSFLIR